MEEVKRESPKKGDGADTQLAKMSQSQKSAKKEQQPTPKKQAAPVK